MSDEPRGRTRGYRWVRQDSRGVWARRCTLKTQCSILWLAYSRKVCDVIDHTASPWWFPFWFSSCVPCRIPGLLMA